MGMGMAALSIDQVTSFYYIIESPLRALNLGGQLILECKKSIGVSYIIKCVVYPIIELNEAQSYLIFSSVHHFCPRYRSHIKIDNQQEKL